jgi:hypothetical protein
MRDAQLARGVKESRRDYLDAASAASSFFIYTKSAAREQQTSLPFNCLKVLIRARRCKRNNPCVPSIAPTRNAQSSRGDAEQLEEHSQDTGEDTLSGFSVNSRD